MTGWNQADGTGREEENHAANSEKNSVPPPLVPFCFKPGQSGNPSGRPKRKPLTEAYAAILDKPIPGDKEGHTFAEAIALAMAKEAIKGKVNAAAELADRVEGRALQQIKMTESCDPLAELLSEFRREYESLPKTEAPDATS